MLFDTLATDELLTLPVAVLLHRLFHEEDFQVLDQRALRFACSCSRDRVAAMLQSLGKDEAYAALADGVASIRCEFCGHTYLFDRQQIEDLFVKAAVHAPASDKLQ